MAAQFVAEEFLRLEGFTEVQYVDTGNLEQAVASGQVHLSQTFAAPLVTEIDRGSPVVALTGIHVGCFEVFGTDQVRTVRDLTGPGHSISAACSRVIVNSYKNTRLPPSERFAHS
jgi:NitT/TauT family transport system substrate-binding protein